MGGFLWRLESAETTGRFDMTQTRSLSSPRAIEAARESSMRVLYAASFVTRPIFAPIVA
jgi:hypothetical protein